MTFEAEEPVWGSMTSLFVYLGVVDILSPGSRMSLDYLSSLLCIASMKWGSMSGAKIYSSPAGFAALVNL